MSLGIMNEVLGGVNKGAAGIQWSFHPESNPSLPGRKDRQMNENAAPIRRRVCVSVGRLAAPPSHSLTSGGTPRARHVRSASQGCSRLRGSGPAPRQTDRQTTAGDE